MSNGVIYLFNNFINRMLRFYQIIYGTILQRFFDLLVLTEIGNNNNRYMLEVRTCFEFLKYDKSGQPSGLA